MYFSLILFFSISLFICLEREKTKCKFEYRAEKQD